MPAPYERQIKAIPIGLFNLKLINIFKCSMKIRLVNIKHYLHNQFDSIWI